MRADEGEQSGVLWVILTLVFQPVLLYVAYFLGRDFYRHERREDGVWEDITRAMDTLGIPVSVRRDRPMPERSFVLYFVLSIVTLGLFTIYWLYTLIEDPNLHFRNHIRIEDDVLAALSGAAS